MRPRRSALTALVLGAALATPAVAAAKPITTFPTADQPTTFQQNRCIRWETRLNDTQHEIDMGRATQKDLDKQISRALDEGCAVIH
jgi:hypothetical protein